VNNHKPLYERVSRLARVVTVNQGNQVFAECFEEPGRNWNAQKVTPSLLEVFHIVEVAEEMAGRFDVIPSFGRLWERIGRCDDLVRVLAGP
jgi:hypothetical protein